MLTWIYFTANVFFSFKHVTQDASVVAGGGFGAVVNRYVLVKERIRLEFCEYTCVKSPSRRKLLGKTKFFAKCMKGQNSVSIDNIVS